ENSLPCGARSVNNALHAATMLGANRNDEAVVAQGDVVFATAGANTLAKNLPQGFLDRIARLHNAGANPAQRGRSVVADFFVGEDAAPNRCQCVAKIREIRCALEEERKPGFVSAKLVAQPASRFQQRRAIEKLGRLEDRAGTLELLEPCLGVGQAAK